MSSSFRDTFTRDDKKDYLLDYDDSAFYYFLGACIFVVALPWALALLKKFIFGSSQKALKGKRCRCSNCQKITRNFKKKAKRDWLKCSFFVQVYF
jgi:translocation protein SEC63